jgi:hypothetical protein
MENDNKNYETTNFHICVWLQMNGIHLKDVDWANKRRAKFIFDDFEDRELLVSNFFKQEQLQNYISVSQETKARMYAVNPPVEYERS